MSDILSSQPQNTQSTQNQRWEYPLLEDGFDPTVAVDWDRDGDAVALLVNLHQVRELVLVCLAPDTPEEARTEARAQLDAATAPYKGAVLMAQVPAWVRSCAATAVPMMVFAVEGTGGSPGNAVEFGLAYKTMMEKYQAAQENSAS